MNRMMAGIVLVLAAASCQAQKSVEDLSAPPPVVAADEPYAGVFAPLDGLWEGEFIVYQDSAGQAAGPAQPQDSAALDFPLQGKRVITRIHVLQRYISETPYFQRVLITDEYRAGNGSVRTESSRGANKVQDGRLWCVVNKPAETIIHQGEARGGNTLIWQRRRQDPPVIEYFQETVQGDRYRIRGWGYYGDDDPSRAPRTWFAGEYRRAN